MVYLKKLSSLEIYAVKPKKTLSLFFYDWLKHIDKDPFIIIAKLIAFLLSRSQKVPTQKEIPGLKIFLFSATQPVQYYVIFRRLITNYSELLIFQFVRRESYITASDMVQMKIYTFKRRHGGRWKSCLVYKCSK